MRLDLLETLKERASEPWLIGLDAGELSDRATQRFRELTQADRPNQAVLLAAPEAIDFLAGFIAAVAADCPVFLGNPQWQEAEWQTVLPLVNPSHIWATNYPCAIQNPLKAQSPPSLLRSGKIQLGDLGGVQGLSKSLVPLQKSSNPNTPPSPIASQFPTGVIAIPTGGTSGQIRFALHTWETLAASVAAFRGYFQTDSVNSCCVLPLFHVSGLMQFMRSFLSGGKFALFASKELEQQIQQIDPSEFFISLVPTQLQRLLDKSENLEWLARFQTILLGGAPPWSGLLDQARSHQIRIAITYGMTETASQVVALKPEDFLRGQTGCGQPLPHAQITICDSQGNFVEPEAAPSSSPLGAIGTIHIRAKSLCCGYLPALPDSSLEQTQELVTDDLGYFDSAGYLHLIGRNSQKMITGGENVFPAEVEAAIRQTGLVQDVCVVGLPDRLWGEAVTAIIVPITHASISDLESALSSKLTRYKQPKHWITVDRIPRSPQGKINDEQIRKLALEGTIAPD